MPTRSNQVVRHFGQCGLPADHEHPQRGGNCQRFGLDGQSQHVPEGGGQRDERQPPGVALFQESLAVEHLFAAEDERSAADQTGVDFLNVGVIADRSELQDPIVGRNGIQLRGGSGIVHQRLMLDHDSLGRPVEPEVYVT